MSLIPLKLAGFRVLMEARYSFSEKQCAGYLADFSPSDADFTVSVTPEVLEAEISQNEKTGLKVSEGYAESVCLYRSLCLQLPKHDALLLHAAVISDGKYAYAFTAPSGTGKSTHIKLWRQAFGESIYVINGDKPILRLTDGQWWVYGTPWCGKEGWQANVGQPLSALCFLERGKENSIQRLSPVQAVPRLMHQVLFPSDPESLRSTMSLMDHLVTHTPLYHLACNISTDAARVARSAMMPNE